jgi:hypothetical protein
MQQQQQQQQQQGGAGRTSKIKQMDITSKAATQPLSKFNFKTTEL